MRWLQRLRGEPGSSYLTLAFFSACAAMVVWELMNGRRVPFYILLAAPAMVAVSLWNVCLARADAVRDDRLRRGLCPQCGYDLRESPGRCPECGRPTGGHRYDHDPRRS